MWSVCNNTVVLAAAGSRKTEHVIESALDVTNGRVLITTYTNENQRHITKRIEDKVGAIPPNITIMGWFAFLISQCAKPYQRAITGEPLKIRGLNFKGRRNRFTRKSDLQYFLDSSDDIYRDGVSDFVAALNHQTDGAVVGRLERIFSHIFIDEVTGSGRLRSICFPPCSVGVVYKNHPCGGPTSTHS